MIIVMPPRRGRKKDNVFLPFSAASVSYNAISDDRRLPSPLPVGAKIAIGFTFTVIGLMFGFFILLIADSLTRTETKTVRSARLIDVEVGHVLPQKGYPRGDEYVQFELQWPDGGPTWFDSSRVKDMTCLYRALPQVGTVKTVWYHERHSKIFHETQRWTGGGQTFCQ